MKTTFFDLNNYIVDENVDYFRFKNSYKIRNHQGEEIGYVLQKNSASQKILGLLINKNFLPFNMEMKSVNSVNKKSEGHDGLE